MAMAASDFEALQSAMRVQPYGIILYAFDILHLDGKDLRQETLSERRANLRRLLGADDQSRIQFSDEFDGDGDALFKACAEKELEGIVSKHALAPYRSGRSKTWLKTKCFTQSTLVVIGTDRDRKTGALRALLAHKDSAGLSYAGAAFIALGGAERVRFFAELERLATSWAAFKSSRLMDVKWCHPKLVVEVKHLAGSKMLRHATVKAWPANCMIAPRHDYCRLHRRFTHLRHVSVALRCRSVCLAYQQSPIRREQHSPYRVCAKEGCIVRCFQASMPEHLRVSAPNRLRRWLCD